VQPQASRHCISFVEEVRRCRHGCKEEVEVEGEVDGDGLPLAQTQEDHKGRGEKGPPTQPMCQSAWLQKHSATIQRIQAGEGTTREDFLDLMDCNDDEEEWFE
jgi:hypothetical protein